MGLLSAIPMLVSAQTNQLQPNEFSLSGALQGDQVAPAAAFGAGGGFVVWHDNASDPFGLGVSAQRLNANLAPEGPVLHVNQTTPLDQQRPKVAMFSDGSAIVAWQSGRSGLQNVFARILTSSGAFASGEVLANSPAGKSNIRFQTNWTLIYNNKERTRRQNIKESVEARHDFNANPSVAVLADGSAVVAWSSSRVITRKTVGLQEWTNYKENKDGTFTIINNRRAAPITIKEAFMQDVYVQRFSAGGQKLGTEFRANQFVQFNQRDVAIAALDNGNFVLTWASEQQRTNTPVDIYARVFDSSGNPAGNEFCVSTAATRPCGAPAVAGRAGGGFTIAWAQKAEVRTNGMDIYARTFDAAGGATSDAFPVNTFIFGDQFAPSITSLGSQQVIVWSSMGQDGSWEGVYARAFSDSIAQGDEFRVNLWTPLSQRHAQIASDHLGRALILWSGYRPDGSGFDLFGRTYLPAP
jgi:hypothetical protein